MSEKIKNHYLADYYLTKKSTKVGEYDMYDIVDKIKVRLCCSDCDLGDNNDMFILKSELNHNKPNRHDMIFFTNEKKFYEVVEVEEAGDFYIVNTTYCKPKDR